MSTDVPTALAKRSSAPMSNPSKRKSVYFKRVMKMGTSALERVESFLSSTSTAPSSPMSPMDFSPAQPSTISETELVSDVSLTKEDDSECLHLQRYGAASQARCRTYAGFLGDVDAEHVLDAAQHSEVDRTLPALLLPMHVRAAQIPVSSVLCAWMIGGLQVFQTLSAVSIKQVAKNLEISDEHKAYLRRCARRLHDAYHDYDDDGWLQIASLALSYLHTALCKSAYKAYTDRTFYVCWLLAIKFFGAGFESTHRDKDEICDWLYRERRAIDGFDETEFTVLDLLDWQLNVITEHDLLQHLLGALQPAIGAAIRPTIIAAIRLSLEQDGWMFVQRLQDPRGHAEECVRNASGRWLERIATLKAAHCATLNVD